MNMDTFSVVISVGFTLKTEDDMTPEALYAALKQGVKESAYRDLENPKAMITIADANAVPLHTGKFDL